MKTPFKSIALLGRHNDERVVESMRNLAAHLHTRGLEILADQSIPLDFGNTPVVRLPSEQIAARASLAIAVGGDGNLLHAARLLAAHPVPLLGINRGRLGFLTDVSPEDMLTRLDEVLAGQYAEDARTLLEAQLPGRDPETAHALNDIVIQKGETGRMVEFETWIDGTYVNTHSGDGLVVATATGSTAYALSCGGPIVHPALGVIVLAPICPHTLSDRPVVVPHSSKVEIRLVRRADARALIMCDGQRWSELKMGERLRIHPSNNRIKLLHPPGYDYYRLLRSKLHWGRGAHLPRTPDQTPDNIDNTPGDSGASER